MVDGRSSENAGDTAEASVQAVIDEIDLDDVRDLLAGLVEGVCDRVGVAEVPGLCRLEAEVDLVAGIASICAELRAAGIVIEDFIAPAEKVEAFAEVAPRRPRSKAE